MSKSGRPSASSEHVRLRMVGQRRRDTALELTYRRALFRLGLRYRVDHRIPPLRRRADIAFTRWKVATFLDGCFWHMCPLHASLPKNNGEWWSDKLRANVRRDRHTDDELTTQGWRVVRIWEHESVPDGIDRIFTALQGAGMAPRPITVDASGHLPEQRTRIVRRETAAHPDDVSTNGLDERIVEP